MARGKELWDDSALVDAFDRAVASFKEAHMQAAVSAEDEDKTTHGAEDEEEPTNCKISDEHTDQDDKVANTEEVQDEESVKDNDANSYDELLKQYYELEEKRQTILQQIYTHPNYYNQAVQPDVYNDTPERAAQDPQYLNPACVGCCLPISVSMTGGNSCGPCDACFSICQLCDKCPDKYAGCTVAVPCSTGLTKHSGDMDDSTNLKKATTLAESAMRAINANMSGKESETVGINECLESIGISDANLVPVLNAWYSAGFHTARFLSEKSRQNNS